MGDFEVTEWPRRPSRQRVSELKKNKVMITPQCEFEPRILVTWSGHFTSAPPRWRASTPVEFLLHHRKPNLQIGIAPVQPLREKFALLSIITENWVTSGFFGLVCGLTGFRPETNLIQSSVWMPLVQRNLTLTFFSIVYELHYNINLKEACCENQTCDHSVWVITFFLNSKSCKLRAQTQIRGPIRGLKS